jgi:hypothetical protein
VLYARCLPEFYAMLRCGRFSLWKFHELSLPTLTGLLISQIAGAEAVQADDLRFRRCTTFGKQLRQDRRARAFALSRHLK